MRSPSGSTQGGRGSNAASGERPLRQNSSRRSLCPGCPRRLRPVWQGVVAPPWDRREGPRPVHRTRTALANATRRPRPRPWRFVASPSAETAAQARRKLACRDLCSLFCQRAATQPALRHPLSTAARRCGLAPVVRSGPPSVRGRGDGEALESASSACHAISTRFAWSLLHAELDAVGRTASTRHCPSCLGNRRRTRQSFACAPSSGTSGLRSQATSQDGRTTR